jgi:hypothetical protein
MIPGDRMREVCFSRTSYIELTLKKTELGRHFRLRFGGSESGRIMRVICRQTSPAPTCSPFPSESLSGTPLPFSGRAERLSGTTITLSKRKTRLSEATIASDNPRQEMLLRTIASVVRAGRPAQARAVGPLIQKKRGT